MACAASLVGGVSGRFRGGRFGDRGSFLVCWWCGALVVGVLGVTGSALYVGFSRVCVWVGNLKL